jgi:crotonobetainyl-CoA:carnitine CoA-transferase CaiB-like acyl-CoA transferase
MPGNPVKLSAAAPAAFTRPPQLGEHTQAVLATLLGYSDAAIGQLQRSGAIA